MKKEPFVILVYIALKPDFEDEYLSLINGVVDQMRHEASFVNAVVHRSADDPTLFVLHETWLDREEFFAVQMKRPYRQTYEARLPEIMRAPREVKILEPLRREFIFRDN
jgi:quinol monooxygenase YgiN